MAVIYSTPADVAVFMGIPVGDLPVNILTLIARAQDLIDYITLNRINDYYLDNLATFIDDPEISLAAQNATSAQIEYWLNIGADTDIINNGNISNFGIGNFSMTFGGAGATNASMAVLAPRANRYLMLVGLMYRGIWRA
jgi:hypothetical protein